MASNASTSSKGDVTNDPKFEEFYEDIKRQEAEDAKLTPKQQIDRLLRPGYTYRNLNPFEVLQIDPEATVEEAKKRFRRMSILVHPDKNPDDKERAQIAFDAVKRAWTVLETKETRAACMEIVEEARGRTKMNIEEKKRKLAKEKKPTIIDEDNPIFLKKAIGILTMKLFADLERKRMSQENKISEDAQKKRDMEVEAEEKRLMRETYAKNWEESRQGRVDSWMTFKGKKPYGSTGKEKSEKKVKKAKYTPIGFRPPKPKPEQR